ncbi:MAG TPA: PaaI family thioesterase [Phenylobacterium sp.]
MDGSENSYETTLKAITEGEWAGWNNYAGGDPFEEYCGPYYWRRDPDGTMRCAFRAERKHMNGGMFMHGGAIMTFADYALFVIAREALQNSHSVTATFNGEFVGSVPEGAIVECTGEVVKAGRSMVFVRGLITTGPDPVMSFSAVIKKTGPRDKRS